MVEVLDRLKSCLYTHNDELFSSWLVASNCSRVSQYLRLMASNCSEPGPYLSKSLESTLQNIVYESLREIFDVLMRCPEADYFWYTYPENGGKLTWAEPHHKVVPSDSLRVDKEKIKVFLRDIKIQMLLDAN